MTKGNLEKDVIPLISNKRESFLGYTFHFHGDVEVKNTNYYYQHLEIILLLQNKK